MKLLINESTTSFGSSVTTVYVPKGCRWSNNGWNHPQLLVWFEVKIILRARRFDFLNNLVLVDEPICIAYGFYFLCCNKQKMKTAHSAFSYWTGQIEKYPNQKASDRKTILIPAGRMYWRVTINHSLHVWQCKPFSLLMGVASLFCDLGISMFHICWRFKLCLKDSFDYTAVRRQDHVCKYIKCFYSWFLGTAPVLGQSLCL